MKGGHTKKNSLCVCVRVKKTSDKKGLEVKETYVGKSSEVKKTSIRKGLMLLGVGIRFGAPFSRDLGTHEFDAKEIVNKTRGTHCSQRRKKQNKFACVFTVRKDQKSRHLTSDIFAL